MKVISDQLADRFWKAPVTDAAAREPRLGGLLRDLLLHLTQALTRLGYGSLF